MSETETFEQVLDKLPAKRRVFVLAYLDCLNASEAASRAKYAKPGQEGHRLLKIAEVAEAVRLGMQQKAPPKEEVIARLALLATASLEDFISLDASPSIDDSEYPQFTETSEDEKSEKAKPHPGHWRLDLAKAKQRGVMGALKKLKWGEHGPELELHSPEGPLTTLARHYGMLVERKEVSGPNGTPIIIETADMQQARADLETWRQEQKELLSNLSSAAPIVPSSPTNTDS